jgi:flagellar FliL protein
MLFAVVGSVVGIIFSKGNGIISKKQSEKLYLPMEELYCNVKESKKIVKARITVEVRDKKTLKDIGEKQFLIRDEINKIIRSKTEDKLKGKEGQIALQKEITDSLVKIFDDNNISNIYFDDFIIQ